MINLQNIARLINDGQPEEALRQLETIVDTTADSYFLQGKALWRLGRRQQAMSAYLKAAELDPQSPAVQALEHASDIESFFNPDLLNP